MTWVVRTSFFFSFGCRFEPSLKFFIVGVGSTPWLVEWKQLDNLYKHSETEEMRKKKLRVKINQNRDFFYFCKKLKSYWLVLYSDWTNREIHNLYFHILSFLKRIHIILFFHLNWVDRYIHGRGPTTQTGSDIEEFMRSHVFTLFRLSLSRLMAVTQNLHILYSAWIRLWE